MDADMVAQVSSPSRPVPPLPLALRDVAESDEESSDDGGMGGLLDQLGDWTESDEETMQDDVMDDRPEHKNGPGRQPGRAVHFARGAAANSQVDQLGADVGRLDLTPENDGAMSAAGAGAPIAPDDEELQQIARDKVLQLALADTKGGAISERGKDVLKECMLNSKRGFASEMREWLQIVAQAPSAATAQAVQATASLTLELALAGQRKLILQQPVEAGLPAPEGKQELPEAPPAAVDVPPGGATAADATALTCVLRDCAGSFTGARLSLVAHSLGQALGGQAISADTRDAMLAVIRDARHPQAAHMLAGLARAMGGSNITAANALALQAIGLTTFARSRFGPDAFREAGRQLYAAIGTPGGLRRGLRQGLLDQLIELAGGVRRVDDVSPARLHTTFIEELVRFSPGPVLNRVQQNQAIAFAGTLTQPLEQRCFINRLGRLAGGGCMAEDHCALLVKCALVRASSEDSSDASEVVLIWKRLDHALAGTSDDNPNAEDHGPRTDANRTATVNRLMAMRKGLTLDYLQQAICGLNHMQSCAHGKLTVLAAVLAHGNEFAPAELAHIVEGFVDPEIGEQPLLAANQIIELVAASAARTLSPEHVFAAARALAKCCNLHLAKEEDAPRRTMQYVVGGIGELVGARATTSVLTRTVSLTVLSFGGVRADPAALQCLRNGIARFECSEETRHAMMNAFEESRK